MNNATNNSQFSAATVYQPKAIDSKAVRELLSANGFGKRPVKKTRWAIVIGCNPVLIPPATAKAIIALLESHGYFVGMRDTTFELIDLNLCFDITVHVTAKSKQ